MINRMTAVLAAVTVFFSSLSMGIFYHNYSSRAENVALIPGLDDGYVPQGSTYLEEEETYISCGYLDDDSPSRIYLLKDGEEKLVFVKKLDGTQYKGHAGGITACGDYIYVSNAEKIFVIFKADLLSCEDGESVSFVAALPVPCRSSFCSCDGEILYVGEYHADDYETDPTHALTTPDGSEYAALVFGYKIDIAAPYGVDTSVPVKIFSVCDEVQGFAVTPEGKAALSVSAGYRNSKLLIYDIESTPEGEFTYNGEKIPLFYLDSNFLDKKITLPRMSEDLEYTDGGLLLSFESGADKFYPKLLPFEIKYMILLDIT